MPMTIKLKSDIIDIIKSDISIRTKLAIALRKSYPTIQRYVNENNEMLTTAGALEVLRSELKKTNEDLLTN